MPRGRPTKRPTTLASQQRRRSKPPRHPRTLHESIGITASGFLQVRTSDSEHLRPLYAAAKPFPHIQLREVFASDFLRAVRDEVIGNCSGTLKETDIYKVYQTGELRNLDVLSSEEQTRLGKLRTLRDTLYSDSFRQFLEDVTGCCDAARGEHLDGDHVDCSINVYTSGCHLLCHDDAIGTRRLSYIIYLTDPDQAWASEDGGRLQLFALDGRHQDKDDLTEPEPYPIVSLLPAWNTMTVFQVRPGRSFHAVEEVRSTERPRLSISGWYHVQESGSANGLAPEASLRQLQMCRQRPLTPFAWPASAPDTKSDGVAKGETFTAVSLSTADRAYLSEFLRPEYLQDSTIRAIRKQFLRESSVQLHDFLKTKPIVQQIMVALQETDMRWRPIWQSPSGNSEAPESPPGWETVGPPHRQRFLEYRISSPEHHAASTLENGLSRLDALFCSQSMARYLARLTGLDSTYGRFRSYRRCIRRFRPGLDYTLATHDTLVPPEEPGLLDATLCFVDDTGADKADQWQSGEYGGYECYMDTGDGDDDPSVYREPDDASTHSNHLLNLPPISNTLNLVLRDHQVLRFVKYISAAAPSSRVDLSYEFAMERRLAAAAASIDA